MFHVRLFQVNTENQPVLQLIFPKEKILGATKVIKSNEKKKDSIHNAFLFFAFART
jgi:hypothetical protein